MRTRKWLSLLIVLSAIIVLVDTGIILSKTESHEKPKIAVLDFKAIGGEIDREFGEGVSERKRGQDSISFATVTARLCQAQAVVLTAISS